MHQKGFAPILLVLLIVAIITSGGILFYKNSGKQKVIDPHPGVKPVPSVVQKQASVSYTPSPIDSLTITSTSKIELFVTDPKGRQIGLSPTTKKYVNTLPGAFYGLQQGLVDDTGARPPLPDMIQFGFLDTPQNGIYIVQVIGIKEGKYHIDVYFSSTSTPIDGVLKINQIDTYKIEFPKGTIEKLAQ